MTGQCERPASQSQGQESWQEVSLLGVHPLSSLFITFIFYRLFVELLLAFPFPSPELGLLDRQLYASFYFLCFLFIRLLPPSPYVYLSLKGTSYVIQTWGTKQKRPRKRERTQREDPRDTRAKPCLVGKRVHTSVSASLSLVFLCFIIVIFSCTLDQSTRFSADVAGSERSEYKKRRKEGKKERKCLV